MSKYLITATDVYRVDSEAEAKHLIEESKHSSYFVLTKYSSEYKEVKLKGEVIDTYYKVTLVKAFNNIKEPDSEVDVSYGFDVQEVEE